MRENVEEGKEVRDGFDASVLICDISSGAWNKFRVGSTSSRGCQLTRKWELIGWNATSFASSCAVVGFFSCPFRFVLYIWIFPLADDWLAHVHVYICLGPSYHYSIFQYPWCITTLRSHQRSQHNTAYSTSHNRSCCLFSITLRTPHTH